MLFGPKAHLASTKINLTPAATEGGEMERAGGQRELACFVILHIRNKNSIE